MKQSCCVLLVDVQHSPSAFLSDKIHKRKCFEPIRTTFEHTTKKRDNGRIPYFKWLKVEMPNPMRNESWGEENYLANLGTTCNAFVYWICMQVDTSGRG